MPQVNSQLGFAQLLQDFPGGSSPKVLVEGDSWVSHPFLPNITVQLDMEGNGRFCILNLAQPGDTSKRMLGREGQQFKQLTQLIETKRWGYKWDFIFISAAGNDIVGDEIMGFVDDWAPGKTGRQFINATYDTEIKSIVDDYERLLKSRDDSEENKDTPIITHTYAYLEPRLVGTKLFGAMFGKGWVQQYLDDKGFKGRLDDQRDIVRGLLDKFHDALAPLQTKYKHFLVVDNRKLLSTDANHPNVAWWHDEIHPNFEGFKMVGKAVRGKMEEKGYWPT